MVEVPSLTFEVGTHEAPSPPLLKGAPVVGNLPSFLRDPSGLFHRGYRKCGPVFRIRLIRQPVVVLAGPESVLFFTKNERQFFSVKGLLDKAAALLEVSADSLTINVDGDRHRELRTNQKDPMSRGYFEGHVESVAGIARRFVAALPTGHTLPIADFSKRLIFEQMGSIMAGEAALDMYDDMKVVLDAIINTLLKPWTNWLPPSRRLRRARAALRRFAAETGARCEPIDPEARHNLVESFILGVRGGVYEDRDLSILMAFPYLAGLDTLAHAMAFTLFALVENRSAYERVQAEVDRVLDQGPLTADLLREMSCLRGAIMESMRMYPIASSIRRIVTENVELNGYQLRRGDVAFVATAMAHRMPEYFPDPNTFDIDRYGKDRAEHRTPGVFKPYGAGAHTCLGAGLADAQIAVNVATILRCFDVAFDRPNYKLKVRGIPTPAPVGVGLVFHKRSREPE